MKEISFSWCKMNPNPPNFCDWNNVMSIWNWCLDIINNLCAKYSASYVLTYRYWFNSEYYSFIRKDDGKSSFSIMAYCDKIKICLPQELNQYAEQWHCIDNRSHIEEKVLQMKALHWFSALCERRINVISSLMVGKQHLRGTVSVSCFIMMTDKIYWRW